MTKKVLESYVFGKPGQWFNRGAIETTTHDACHKTSTCYIRNAMSCLISSTVLLPHYPCVGMSGGFIVEQPEQPPMMLVTRPPLAIFVMQCVFLFSVSKPCLACSKAFTGDIYRDHDVSCTGIVGIKNRHNLVCDTLVDVCFWSGISAGKEVDIGLGGWCDIPLCPGGMLLYLWDGGLNACVDLRGSSPLTQIGMIDFVPGRAVIFTAHHKRVKYEAKCADNGYGFLPFSFSSLG
ncbi:hypothetical protein Tco_0961856 [Tanacetum coccineum]